MHSSIFKQDLKCCPTFNTQLYNHDIHILLFITDKMAWLKQWQLRNKYTTIITISMQHY